MNEVAGVVWGGKEGVWVALAGGQGRGGAGQGRAGAEGVQQFGRKIQWRSWGPGDVAAATRHARARPTVAFGPGSTTGPTRHLQPTVASRCYWLPAGVPYCGAATVQ
jgi:hypothetical protein